MEGVGARLGRSSTRYGPATVFTGPVRKWKKKWVHVTPSAAAAAASSNNHQHHQASNGNSSSNGNNNNASHIMLYKWTPISQSHNNSANNNSNGDATKEDGHAAEVEEEPPRRKMKYIPIAVLEEQNEASGEQIDGEVKPIETDPDAAEDPNSKRDDVDEKPDINDVPMEENRVSEDNHVKRQDLNESTLDLSFNLNAREEDEDPEEAKDQTKDGQLDRVSK